MEGFEQVCLEAAPDYVIVVGDVNSTVACALTSVKMGIPTAHVEAGLRSGDRAMPEEINRLATDAIVDDLFITEPSGLAHLIREGAHQSHLFLVGNTMIDSMHYALPKSELSTVHARLGLQPNNYAVVTLHRPSNVDDPTRLAMVLGVLQEIGRHVTVVFPMHPRTRRVMGEAGLDAPPNVLLIEPVGYVDFLALLRSARLTLTDSGGIQEETTALGVPCITARTSTERPITVELGTNVLVDPEREPILATVNKILAGNVRTGRVPDLWDGHAAERIASIITERYG
jgi:UDP-N-acetylglucosamine 2-epimerase (non-hydrolysing)